MKRSRDGFTLIEIMVVVVIISILATIVVTGVFEAQRRADLRLTKVSIREASKAILLYKLEKRHLPDSFQQVVAERFAERVPQDSWGQPLEYSKGQNYPNGYTIMSRGDPDAPQEIWLHSMDE